MLKFVNILPSQVVTAVDISWLPFKIWLYVQLAQYCSLSNCWWIIKNANGNLGRAQFPQVSCLVVSATVNGILKEVFMPVSIGYFIRHKGYKSLVISETTIDFNIHVIVFWESMYVNYISLKGKIKASTIRKNQYKVLF